MERVGKSEEEMISEARETAGRRLRRSLVLDEFADAEDIEVPEEDVEAELAALKARREAAGDSAPLDEDGARTSIERMLRRQRAMDHIVALVRSDDGDIAKTEVEEEDTREDPADASSGDGQ